MVTTVDNRSDRAFADFSQRPIASCLKAPLVIAKSAGKGMYGVVGGNAAGAVAAAIAGTVAFVTACVFSSLALPMAAMAQLVSKKDVQNAIKHGRKPQHRLRRCPIGPYFPEVEIPVARAVQMATVAIQTAPARNVEMKALRAALDDSRAEIAAERMKQKELIEKYSGQLGALRRGQVASNRHVDQMRREYKGAFAELKRRHAAALGDMQAKHAREIQALKANLTKAEEKVGVLGKENRIFQEAFHSMKDEHDRELHTQKQAHAEEMSELAGLKSRLDEVQAAKANLTADHEHQLQQLRGALEKTEGLKARACSSAAAESAKSKKLRERLGALSRDAEALRSEKGGLESKVRVQAREIFELQQQKEEGHARVRAAIGETESAKNAVDELKKKVELLRGQKKQAEADRNREAREKRELQAHLEAVSAGKESRLAEVQAEFEREMTNFRNTIAQLEEDKARLMELKRDAINAAGDRKGEVQGLTSRIRDLQSTIDELAAKSREQQALVEVLMAGVELDESELERMSTPEKIEVVKEHCMWRFLFDDLNSYELGHLEVDPSAFQAEDEALEREVDNEEQFQDFLKKEKAATAIQAAFRGHRARKDLRARDTSF